MTHLIAPSLEEAKKRMDEGFAFVGITDEWDLSICLFPVPSLYLPCTFPVPSLYLPCTFHRWAGPSPSSAAARG